MTHVIFHFSVYIHSRGTGIQAHKFEVERKARFISFAVVPNYRGHVSVNFEYQHPKQTKE